MKDRLPVCMSCVFGMAHHRPWRSKGTPGTIRKEDETDPGDCVSIDQLVSAQPGLIPQMSGFLTNHRIWGATIFVDHVSDYVFVALMRDLTLDETLLAKTSFERLAQNGGVRIKAYRADNGRFADKGFRDSVEQCNQQITYCAVGAHHQNGIVERRIKELTLIARTLLLHAVRHWPGYITTMLWPFALKEAAFRLNYLHFDENGRSNAAKFFGIENDTTDPSIFHAFGSPCFVLDSRLQSGVAGAPKWDPRSRLGIYVGHSPSHAGNVALVLNPNTGHVSPQYHVVFDDGFTTVPFMNKNQVPPNWAELVQSSRELVTEEQVQLANTWLHQDASGTAQSAGPAIDDINTTSNPPPSLDDTTGVPNALPRPGTLSQHDSILPDEAPTSPRPSGTMSLHDSILPREAALPGLGNPAQCATEQEPQSTSERSISCALDEPLQGPSNSTPHIATQRSQSCEGESDYRAPAMINLETSGHRRSSRIREQSGTSNNQMSSGTLIVAYTSSAKNERPFTRLRGRKPRMALFSAFCGFGSLWSFATSSMPHFFDQKCHSFVSRISHDHERLSGLFDDTINDVIHHVKAFTTSNENFTFNQMLKENDYADFFQAMLDEISVHEQRNHWTLIERRSLPPGTKTIMGIWSFKRKRYPDGSLNKHKARLCAHGGQQTWGQDYWDTYAPVVTWASVRLLLIVAKLHKLESKSIDFVLAFPQADLDVPVFMELPSGVTPIDEIDSNRRKYVLD